MPETWKPLFRGTYARKMPMKSFKSFRELARTQIREQWGSRPGAGGEMS